MKQAFEYTRLKRDLASRFRNELAAYTDSKEDFINRIVAAAQPDNKKRSSHFSAAARSIY